MAIRNPNTLAFEFVAKDKASKSFDRMSTRADRFGSKIGRIAKRTAQAATVMGVAFGVKSVQSFLSFDDAMTRSLAIMGDVDDAMRNKMEKSARRVGKTTRISATEAGEAFFYLASAGLDAEQSLAAMPQVAAFAQAGMFDMSRATDLATDAQSALGLKVDDAQQNLGNLTRVTDVFVKANTMANATVEQFATSMTRKAGAALRNLGKDIEEGTAALAVFADQGIKGRRAGTILRATLDGLSNQARKNADEFEKFNVTVFDGQGNVRNLADITKDLEKAFKGMSVEEREAALAQMGFNKRAREGMLAMIGNSDELRNFEAALNDAGNMTQEVKDKQLESFMARIDVMKGKVEDVALTVGEKLTGAIFDLGDSVKPVAGKIKTSFTDTIIPAITSGWEEARELLFGKSVNVVSTAGGIAAESVAVQTKSGILDAARETASAFVEEFKTFMFGEKIPVGQLLGSESLSGGGERVGGLVDSISTAFKTHDFSPVGEAIGEAIGDSLFAIGKIGAKIIEVIAGIDWVALGIKAGGLVIPFALGLVTGFINSVTDPDMWAQFGPHLFEIVMAAIGLAFAPAKLVTGLARILAKIPFVGRFLAWLLEAFASLSRKIVRPVLGFIGKIFGTFIQGLTGGAAGRVAIRFIEWLNLFPTRIGVAALNVAQAAGNLMRGLGAKILSFAGAIGRWIGKVIGWLTKPFRTAGGWLISWGRALVQGLGSGILAMVQFVGRIITRFIGWVTKPFISAGKWLIEAGKKVVFGLRDGIVAIANTIGRWLWNNLIQPLIRAHVAARDWLFSAGKRVVFGLRDGIVNIANTIARWLKNNVIDKITGAFTASRDWLVNAGKNAVRGIKDGMVALLSKPVDWFKSVGNKIIDGVKSFFGISSPSKVFAGFGGDLVRGLIKGMITSGSGLTGVVKNVFGSMPKALGHLVKEGVLAVSELPGKAINALQGLGSAGLDLLGDAWGALFGSDDPEGAGKAARRAGKFTGQVMPPDAFRVGRGSQSHGYLARDLPAPTGTPVFAPFAGNVNARSVVGSYGNHVRLAGAGLEFLAAHLSSFGKLGKVDKGDLIGYVGSTGNSTGPHLHVEMRSGGSRINPDVLPGFAAGGFARAGQWGWVGENGPELMRMPGTSGARIFNNRQSEGMDDHEGHGHKGDIIIKDGGSLIGEMKTASGRFSTKQVKDDLRFRGLI